MNGNDNGNIRRVEKGDTTLNVYHSTNDRIKTTVARVKDLERNVLYNGYDEQTAIEVFNECLERFDIDEVESLDEIQWNN